MYIYPYCLWQVCGLAGIKLNSDLYIKPNMKKIQTFIFACALAAPGQAQQGNLCVNHLVEPLGVDDVAPRFSWSIPEGGQQAYRLMVDTDSARLASGNAGVWNSGAVKSAEPACVYAGTVLHPFTTYYWRVQTVSADGKDAVSDISRFETGMMGQENWHGSWISDSHDRDYRPAPYFRKGFILEKPLKRARAYIAVGGLFELSVNGQTVGDHFLDPAFTRYDRRCQYVTFDVTSLLQQGQNAIGVVLGNGWYNHQAMAVWDFDRAPWRNRPTFCLDLRLDYADGTTQTVCTDLSWRTSSGGLIYNNIYTGEHFDFRLLQKGWNEPGFNDSKWHGVRYRQAPAPEISSQQMQPIRLTEHVKAQSLQKVNDSTYVYDFGRNMAGITTVRLKGESGARVSVAHGERLHADGSLDPSNIDVYYRGDKQNEPFQTDLLTLSGAEDTFRARFSYKGFRYVQLVCPPSVQPTKESVEAHFVHSDVATVGSISSSNPLLNGIFAAARQAYLSNLMGYPTDCPQREKNGWTGDGHLAIETALYSFDAFTIYEKWMRDHRDEQQPNGVLPDIVPTDGWGYGTDNGLDWTSTIVIIPWQLYLFYGDIRPLRDCYDNMRRYVDYVDRTSHGHLTTWGRGDWVPVKTPSNKEYTSSVYFFVDATILSKAARLLGHEADAARYKALADEVKAAINAKFFDRQNGSYSGGSQTELSMALMWRLVPEECVQQVADNLAAKVREAGCHLDVGVLGAKAILNALSENGYADLAYKVAVQDTYPSWGWWVKNGATTLLENWDLKATRDISDNHIMFGEIGAWPYKGLGGIFPDENAPGFRNILLRPNFVKELRQFEARHTTPYGEIVSSWQWKGKKVVYDITVPEGSTATFTVPAGMKEAGKTMQLAAGKHQLTLK